MSVEILEREGILNRSEHYVDTVVTAFALVFGREQGPELALQTIEEFKTPGSGLAVAFMFASQEIEAIYSSEEDIFASGFHLFATQKD